MKKYFFIITLSFEKGRETNHGTYEVADNMAEQEIFENIMSKTIKKFETTRKNSCVFFYYIKEIKCETVKKAIIKKNPTKSGN